jgi:diaminopimelate epimerase
LPTTAEAAGADGACGTESMASAAAAADTEAMEAAEATRAMISLRITFSFSLRTALRQFSERSENPVDPSPVESQIDIQMRISKSQNVKLLCQKEDAKVMLSIYNRQLINHNPKNGHILAQ